MPDHLMVETPGLAFQFDRRPLGPIAFLLTLPGMCFMQSIVEIALC